MDDLANFTNVAILLVSILKNFFWHLEILSKDH